MATEIFNEKSMTALQTPVAPAPTVELVTITPKAAEKAKALRAEQGQPDAALRVSVAGGGCSGDQSAVALSAGPRARGRDGPGERTRARGPPAQTPAATPPSLGPGRRRRPHTRLPRRPSPAGAPETLPADRPTERRGSTSRPVR